MISYAVDENISPDYLLFDIERGFCPGDICCLRYHLQLGRVLWRNG